VAVQSGHGVRVGRGVHVWNGCRVGVAVQSGHGVRVAHGVVLCCGSAPYAAGAACATVAVATKAAMASATTNSKKPPSASDHALNELRVILRSFKSERNLPALIHGCAAAGILWFQEYIVRM